MSIHLIQSMMAQGHPIPQDLLQSLPMAIVSSKSRRQSRASKSSPRGSPTKVTKASSTNNSPRGRRQQQAAMPMGVDYSTISRPVSWHSASFEPAMQYQLAYNQVPQYFADQSPDTFQYAPAYSPVQSAYSNNGSPSSFSHMALPPCDFGIPSYLDIPSWDMSEHDCLGLSAASYPNFISATYAPPTDTPHLNDWASFAMNNSFSLNTPPTPEVYPQQYEPSVMPALDGSASACSDDEDDGEILIGMGLYDDDDKFSEDPHLDKARSSMSMLMGSMSTGKGLRLEETWQPPKSDEEDDE